MCHFNNAAVIAVAVKYTWRKRLISIFKQIKNLKGFSFEVYLRNDDVDEKKERKECKRDQ